MISSPSAQSPEYVQVSHAAAMTLGLKGGKFWRGAKLTCINLLLTYEDGCAANCAYCGLARERQETSFIRVNWPTYPVSLIAERVAACADAHRVCISMITRKRAVEDSIAIARSIRALSDTPVSGLISPTVIDRGGLHALREAGVDKIGIAIDAATEPIFDSLRGGGAQGPHRWPRYWECFAEAVEVFGRGQVGSHFIVGLGETEQEMAEAFQRVRDLGGVNHLFSFYPESGTRLDGETPPPMDRYRRAQLAAEIIDRGLANAADFRFDSETGRILDFGLAHETLERLIDDGSAFMTRGCAGRDGRVACNRPFANSAPGPGLRNYPFEPNAEDIALIRTQLQGDWIEPLPVIPAGRSPKGIRKNPRKRGRVHFFAPCIKHFETDEFRNTPRPVFVPVSVTGEACSLGCLYCQGALLKGMYEARSPEGLWALMSRLKGEGCEGLLLTGGCDSKGQVPLAPFAETLGRLKRELGLKTAIHTKFLDEPLAEALGAADLDIAMIDVVGADETIQAMFNMPDGSTANVLRSLDLGESFGLPLAPHIVFGAHAGELRGEYEALAMLKGRKLRALVIVLLMRIGSKLAPPPAPPDLQALERYFRQARRSFPDAPLLLGCARPMGKLQREIDSLALRAGFDGIAYPAEGPVEEARAMNLRPLFSEYCCAMMA